ncbi:MAG: methyl-coenzyme M reductase operon protein D [Euryarchaeota archaeon]|nr:methyl-coenzyme M reductase operon protein D [Euryarchaeota archaeon]MBU4547538.1 methyl-coenzyme M reductase operon protein D [Euryarchaeota archaeon]MBV1755535.1 methyl-coenzyme M reductase operon protein D [Methanobacterium sp.]
MDIEIFPHRLLGADTTEKLLNNLENIDSIKRMVIHGQRLPPASVKHPDRRTIVVKGEEIDLQVKTGRILLEIESEEAIENVKEVCEEVLPFGFNVHIGTFIRYQKTVTDEIKYGDDLDNIPAEMVGLTDQNAPLSERASIIKKNQ